VIVKIGYNVVDLYGYCLFETRNMWLDRLNLNSLK